MNSFASMVLPLPVDSDEVSHRRERPACRRARRLPRAAARRLERSPPPRRRRGLAGAASSAVRASSPASACRQATSPSRSASWISRCSARRGQSARRSDRLRGPRRLREEPRSSASPTGCASRSEASAISLCTYWLRALRARPRSTREATSAAARSVERRASTSRRPRSPRSRAAGWFSYTRRISSAAAPRSGSAQCACSTYAHHSSGISTSRYGTR